MELKDLDKQLRVSFKRIRRDMVSLKERADSLESENYALREEIRYELSKNSDLADEISHLREENKKMLSSMPKEEDVRKNEQGIEELRSSLGDAKRALKDIDANSARKQELTDAVRKLRDMRDTLNKHDRKIKKRESLREELRTLKDMKKKLGKVEETQKSESEDLTDVSRRLSSVESSIEKEAKRRKDMQRSAISLSKLRKEMVSRSEIADLKTDSKRLRKLESESGKLREKLSALEASMKDQVSQQEKRVDSLKEALEEIDEIHEHLMKVERDAVEAKNNAPDLLPITSKLEDLYRRVQGVEGISRKEFDSFSKNIEKEISMIVESFEDVKALKHDVERVDMVEDELKSISRRFATKKELKSSLHDIEDMIESR